MVFPPRMHFPPLLISRPLQCLSKMFRKSSHLGGGGNWKMFLFEFTSVRGDVLWTSKRFSSQSCFSGLKFNDWSGRKTDFLSKNLSKITKRKFVRTSCTHNRKLLRPHASNCLNCLFHFHKTSTQTLSVQDEAKLCLLAEKSNQDTSPEKESSGWWNQNVNESSCKSLFALLFWLPQEQAELSGRRAEETKANRLSYFSFNNVESLSQCAGNCQKKLSVTKRPTKGKGQVRWTGRGCGDVIPMFSAFSACLVEVYRRGRKNEEL